MAAAIPSKKPRVVVIGVNYETDDLAVRFANSVVHGGTAADVDLVLVDNSERTDSRGFFDRVRAVRPGTLCLKPPTNLGYFPGAHVGLQTYRRGGGDPDWVVVSNVDVEFRDRAFWAQLLAMDHRLLDGVLAPWVWSDRLRCNVNPMMERRPHWLRMRFYKLVFKHYHILKCYEALSRLKNVVRGALSRAIGGRGGSSRNGGEARIVYAPDGSCLVFSRVFFDRGGSLEYPSFLFGEEIFVAEWARRLQLQVLYEPRLRVWHDDHASTGVFRSRRSAAHVWRSAEYLADTFFP